MCSTKHGVAEWQSDCNKDNPGDYRVDNPEDVVPFHARAFVCMNHGRLEACGWGHEGCVEAEEDEHEECKGVAAELIAQWNQEWNEEGSKHEIVGELGEYAENNDDHDHEGEEAHLGCDRNNDTGDGWHDACIFGADGFGDWEGDGKKQNE